MEIKRQIIESKNPPSNKEVWWFNSNNTTLERYTGGKWSPILSSGDTPIGPGPDEPIAITNIGTEYDNEIYVYIYAYDEETGESKFTSLEVTDPSMTEANGISHDYNNETGRNTITQENPITSPSDINSLFNEFDYLSVPRATILIVLPRTVTSILDDTFRFFEDLESSALHVVLPGAEGLSSDPFANYPDLNQYLYLGSGDMVEVSYSGEEDWFETSLYAVYVRKSVMSKYEQDSSWTALQEDCGVDIRSFEDDATLNDIVYSLFADA